jgi:8-oxo-dGTP pyrophosphatase MutT (NUDIX family)
MVEEVSNPFPGWEAIMANGLDMQRQAGVIAIQRELMCVVTSRNGKRWVIPKGCLEPGKTSAEIALQEAWEEAGLVGLLSPDPVGSYVYTKAGLLCHVTVFLLYVSEAADDWPERSFRERMWLTFRQAEKTLEEPALQQLIRGVAVQQVG